MKNPDQELKIQLENLAECAARAELCEKNAGIAERERREARGKLYYAKLAVNERLNELLA